ncbi:MAG TPA: threonine/serine dehydratase [Candidatus Dormibacteraeota bacterium]|nr:threonine/serine dehydratase [Candidatus Dormibacteraeota bacterium]
MDTEAAAVTPGDVERAARHLRDHLQPTPLQHSPAFSDRTGARVYLKLESFQPVRSFKLRGALNKLIRLEPERRAAGVITASAGNHGMGVAYAAAEFGVPATVYVPLNANPSKVAAVKRLGARVEAAGRNYSQAYLAAVAEQQDTGATFVHAYEDPDVVAGQGTIALELLDDLEEVDTVVVPIGGGGLIGGIAMYLKSRRPSIRVVGVEPAGADAMKRSLEAGQIVTLDRVNTIADGLAASAPGPLTLDLARRHVDEVVIVSEDEMVESIRLLVEWEHVLAEPAGAAATAALLHRLEPARNERVVVMVTGGNVADAVLRRALEPA